MKLSPRERRTVLIGLVVAVAVGGYSWVLRPLIRSVRGSGSLATRQRSLFADACVRLENYQRTTRELEALVRELNLEIPDKPPSDQMEDLVKRLEALSGRSRVKLNKITRLKSRTRGRTGRSPSRTSLKLDLRCDNFASIVRFIDALENEPVPIAFDQLTITASGGQAGPSRPPTRGPSPPGGSRKEGKIQVALTIHTYLFPGR